MSEEYLREFELYVAEESYEDTDWMSELDLESLAGIRL